MAVNLVSLIMQNVTSSLVSKMGGALGLGRDETQQAVGIGIPAILAGFAGAAAKPQNQQRLSDAMVQQSAGLDQAKTAIDDGRPGALMETGDNLLTSLLGDDMLNKLASAIGRFVGIDPGMAKSLLAMLAPMAAGVIGQQQRNEGLNASGLANLLSSQSKEVMSAMPAGFTSLLGSTGLLDNLGESWRNSAAAAIDSRISDMSDKHVSAGPLAQTSRQGLSASHWPWVIAALAVLAGLGWYLARQDESLSFAEQPLAPTTRPNETTGAGVPDQKLTDLAAELTSSVSLTRSALQGISDPSSARAALPRLKQASAQFDTIGQAISQLPPNSRKGVSSVVTRSMPMLNQLFDRVLASPQTAEVAKPTIDALRTKLDALAKS